MKRQAVVGVFSSEKKILKATNEARESGLVIIDAFTPFPVHGLDAAMGLRKSILPRLCFLFGVSGGVFALLFQWWVFAVDWPMNVGGKSFWALPALIPVTFEVVVLCAGLGTVASLFVLQNLKPGNAPRLAGLGATNDRFLLALKNEGKDEASFLRAQGAIDTQEAEL
jgi:hypothetical protein